MDFLIAGKLGKRPQIYLHSSSSFSTAGFFFNVASSRRKTVVGARTDSKNTANMSNCFCRNYMTRHESNLGLTHFLDDNNAGAARF